MGDYLKLFETHAEYQEYSGGGEMILPNVSYCEDNNEVHYNPIPDYSKEYLTFVAKENGTFTFNPLNSNVISYSTDNGTTWTEGNSVTVNKGDKVLWKGEMTPRNYYGLGKFSSTANFDVQGNVMSLLFGDNFKGQTDLTGKDYAFYQLFYQNIKVINTENLSLPATTLENNCYNGMFYDCTSLTTTPELPATTLASYCYNGMFYDCTSLTTTPELPATTLETYCYTSMFHGCTNLTTAPVLPAIMLAQGCYSGMFQGCTGLTTAPTELPATTLIQNCYYGMFQGCTGLTTAPELPATTLAYQCYYMMFSGCTNLNYIKAMFTTTPSSTYTSNWVSGVSASGTFVKNASATWTTTGVYGVPTGWDVQTAST